MLLLVRRFAVGRMGGLYFAAPWVFVINAPWCNNSHFFHMPASLVSDFQDHQGDYFLWEAVDMTRTLLCWSAFAALGLCSLAGHQVAGQQFVTPSNLKINSSIPAAFGQIIGFGDFNSDGRRDIVVVYTPPHVRLSVAGSTPCCSEKATAATPLFSPVSSCNMAERAFRSLM